MKKTFLLILLLIATKLSAQPYPFQDINLSDEARLDDLISLMSLDEKIAHFASRLPGVPRLGLKGTRIMEGLHGLALSGPANWAVRGKGEAPTTTFPQAYGLAQTWDPDLLQEVAAWEAYECRFLAQNPNYKSAGLIILAPNADLGRDIRWGRTEECYGEDAFLTAKLTTAFVKGLQGDHPKYWKTASLMKHFLANSNENERFINSSDFDERLFHEYYGYAFYQGIVAGGSRAFMAAYNKYNGIPCAVHPVLKNVAVRQWGQNGIICTDGGAFRLLVEAHHYFDDLEQAAAACIKAGITMFLDFYQPHLKKALEKGLVSEAEIDQALRGNLRVMLKLGLLDENPQNPYSTIGLADTLRPWEKDEARALARKATVKSVVLLKNEKNLLPLKKDQLKSIAVIGPSADLVVSDWYSGTPPYRVSILAGIRKAVANQVAIHFALSNKADSAVIAARQSDVAIVCIGNHPLSHGLEWGKNHVFSDGREAIDRQAISLEQEDLVKLVKAANPRTVLVLVSSFPYAINWSKENVPAILHVTQSSQELGNGLADVLFGNESPAGRLVQTWSRSIDELLPILEYDIRKGRTYLYDPHEPLFAFGYGLTYTTFAYKKIEVSKPSIKPGETIDVKVTIANTGNFDSDEVIQLYASFPESKVERPKKALKGFQRVHVPKGTTKTVAIPLAADDLCYWDVDQQQFVLESGRIKLSVGPASNDLRVFAEIRAE